MGPCPYPSPLSEWKGKGPRKWMGSWPDHSIHLEWNGRGQGPSPYSLPNELNGALNIPFPSFGLEGRGSRPLPLLLSEGSGWGLERTLSFIRNGRAGVWPLPLLLTEGSGWGPDHTLPRIRNGTGRGQGPSFYSLAREVGGPWPNPSLHSEWEGRGQGPSLYCSPREADGAHTIPFPSFGMEGQGQRLPLYSVPTGVDGALTTPYPTFGMEGHVSRLLPLLLTDRCPLPLLLSEGSGWGPDRTLPLIWHERARVKPRPFTPSRGKWMGPWPHPSLHSEWKGRGQDFTLYSLPRDVGGALTVLSPHARTP